MLSLLLAFALLAGDGAPPREGRLAFSFEPAAPVKGKDAEVRVRIDALDASGSPLPLGEPPRAVVSGGVLGPLRAVAPGRFEGRWQPSATPQPEVLGIVAVAPRCPLCADPLAVGGARLPVAAAIELPGRSDPGVSTTVEIGGRAWGPVTADRDGRFLVPAIVPPGVRFARATSRTGLGNEKQTKLDLHLDDQPGVACLAWPPRLPADAASRALVACIAWTGLGGALDPAPLVARPARGSVDSVRSDGETWRARYLPPERGAGPDRIAVELGPSRAARGEATVELATGPPATIEWTVEGEPAVPGGELGVRARALDARGNPLGEAVAVGATIEAGRLRVSPTFGDGRQRLTLRFALPPGDDPAQLTLHRVGTEWIAAVRDVSGRPVPAVALRFGSGAERSTDARGEARVPARGATETVSGPRGLEASGAADAARPVPAVSIEREVTVALRPAGAVDVAATIDGRWLRWRVLSPEGSALTGRRVTIAPDGVEVGPIEPAGDGGRCALRGGRGTVTVTDEESGAAALVEVR